MKKDFSLIIIIFLFSLIISYHLYYYCINEINNNEVEEITNQEKSFPPQEVEKKEDQYLGILSIPKINLKKVFYPLNDSKNNVNQNIQLLSNSSTPDIMGTSLILAAHSGNSYLGYFKNLYKLIINDEIIIYYQSKEYHYYVNDIEKTIKNGKITYQKNVNDNYLVLTTCSGNNEQLIVVAKLKRE